MIQCHFMQLMFMSELPTYLVKFQTILQHTVFENCVLGAGPITGNLSRFILSKTKRICEKNLLQDLKALYVN